MANLWTHSSQEREETVLRMPLLTRELCFSSKQLRSFLKRSRLFSDDHLVERLNSAKNSCDTVAKTILLPAWNERETVLRFCWEEAEKSRKIIDRSLSEESTKPEFDLRTNPYAEQDFENLKLEKYQAVTALENWVKNERGVEKIVRDRSMEIFSERCGKSITN